MKSRKVRGSQRIVAMGLLVVVAVFSSLLCHAQQTQSSTSPADLTARQEREVETAVGGVGGGVQGGTTALTGANLGLYALLASGYNVWRHYQVLSFTGTLQMNLVNLDQFGRPQPRAGGGVRGYVNFFLGAHTTAAHRSCGLYGGAQAIAQIAVYSHATGQTMESAALGPETGFLCRWGDLVFMLGGTAGLSIQSHQAVDPFVPGAPVSHIMNDRVSSVGVHAGLASRLWIRPGLMVQAQGRRSLWNLPTSYGSQTSPTVNAADLSVHAGVRPGLAFVGYVQVFGYEPSVAPAASSNPENRSHHDAQIGVGVLSRFQ